MPKCPQCSSVVEPQMLECPACGAVVAGGSHEELPDIEARPRLPAGVLGASSDSVFGRRGQVTALPRVPASPASGTNAVFGRHNAALALGHVRSADESRPEGTPQLRLQPQSRTADGGGQVLSLLRAAPVASPPAKGSPAGMGTSVEEPTHEVDEANRSGAVDRQPTRSADTGSRLTPAAQSAARPPVLASEALRRDLAPAAPAKRQVRTLAVLVGSLGFATAWLVCGPHGLGVPIGGAFLALAVLGLAPMTYQARAAALVTVAGSGLTVVTWHRFEHAHSLESLELMIGVTVLAMALFFRSWHRASLLARALVALGVALSGGWLWMSHALQHLLILESQWQAWLPPVFAVPLAILLLLSLLAFMDSRSTGSCSAWAGLLLAWYTLFTWSELLSLYFPLGAQGFDFDRVHAEVAVALLSGPLFATALASGLAQLMAVATAPEAD